MAKKKIKFEDIKTMDDIEQWLNENDTYEWEKKNGTGGHVSIIYGDGTHCSSKGGDLLFQRSLHEFGKALIFNKNKMMKLKHDEGAQSFVVLPDGDNIYKKIKEIWEASNEKPKKMSAYDKQTVDDFITVCKDYWGAVQKLAYDLRQEVYDARKERKPFEDEWLNNNPMTYKYRNRTSIKAGNNQKASHSNHEEATRRERDERRLQMKQEIPMPLRHLHEDKIDFYNLIEYMAQRGKALTSVYVKPTPETIWRMLLVFAPIDSDTKYYIDQFLKDEELKKRYHKLAVRLNRLAGKYDHIMYQDEIAA